MQTDKNIFAIRMCISIKGEHLRECNKIFTQ